MELEEYLLKLNIRLPGEYGDDAYVIDLKNSDEYGKMFTLLDLSDDLDIMQDNQVITDQGSSLTYESLSEPYLFNLLADFSANQYQLVINKI